MSRREENEAIAAWQGWPAVIVVLGLAMSSAAWLYFERIARLEARIVFEAQARDRIALIAHSFERVADAVTVIADLIRVQPEISPDEFERFGQHILDRQPLFSSLGYSEWTPADRLEGLVARMQREGYPMPGVTVRPDPGGDYVLAPADGEARLVLTRFAPSAIGHSLVGFDVASPPDRRSTVLSARDEGKLRMTGPLQLGGRPPDEAGVLLFVPVYRADVTYAAVEERRQAFVGAASIGLLVEPMIRHLLAPHDTGWVRTVVVDGGDDSSAASVLFDQFAPGTQRLETNLDALARHPLAFWTTLEVGGRTWRVLSVPTPAFLAQRQKDFAPLLALVLGGAITLLAAVLASSMLQHERDMRGHVAEREAVAVQLAEANASLTAANQEMEEFVSAVSHDLRNPLYSITLAGNLLQMGLDREDSAAVRRGAEILGRSTSTMTRIVDDLLEHSRAGWAPVQPERVDLAEVVKRITSERAEQIEACRARVEVLPLPTLEGDAGRLTAALDNLLDNALKHACTATRGGDPWIRFSSRSSDEEVSILVSDNGPGIPAEHRQRVFNLFQRYGTEANGSGLGLAIVARVASAHHGRAWVEETPGGGTTVVMAFPQGPRSTS